MLSTFHKNHKGFTLIELMIVVVIIGILAALAVPQFMKATPKMKQSEAKRYLKQIYTMQLTFKQGNDAFWIPGDSVVANAANPNAFATLGVEIDSTARYTYSFPVANATEFTCQATVASPGLDEDPTPDTWTINEKGEMVCTSDDSAH